MNRVHLGSKISVLKILFYLKIYKNKNKNSVLVLLIFSPNRGTVFHYIIEVITYVLQ